MTRTNLLRALPFGILLALAGCSGGDDVNPPIVPAPSLYVTGGQINSVYAFDDAGTVTGNVAPDRLISGANTSLANPYGIDHDSRSDSIFVGNWTTNRVVIYDGASTKTGNIAPSRVVAGASTGLAIAHDVAVDETRDLLYVSGGHGVAVFAGARTVNGNVAPVRRIAGPATQLSTIGDLRMHLDATNDRLYVADPDVAPPRVHVFDAVSTKTGDVAPNRTIVGASTTLSYPWGLAVDVGRDLMYVGDQVDNSVTVFANASTATGNVAPVRKIKGPTSTIMGVSDVFVDESQDTIYVTDADSDRVLVWTGASSRTGDVAPTRAVGGAATGFNYPGGVVVAR